MEVGTWNWPMAHIYDTNYNLCGKQDQGEDV
jgi:hypothetical protein